MFDWSLIKVYPGKYAFSTYYIRHAFTVLYFTLLSLYCQNLLEGVLFSLLDLKKARSEKSLD